MFKPKLLYSNIFYHLIFKSKSNLALFPNDQAKKFFIELLEKKKQKFQLKIFAFGIIDQLYEVLFQNNIDDFSMFFNEINSEYLSYLKMNFNLNNLNFDESKTILIQKGPYLKLTIYSIFLRPVREIQVKYAWSYPWSSLNHLFNWEPSTIIETEVESLLISRKMLYKKLQEMKDFEIEPSDTPLGLIFGDEYFYRELNDIQNNIESTKKNTKQNSQKDKISINKPKTELIENNNSKNKSAQSIIDSVQKEYGYPIAKINPKTRIGKQIRTELVIKLKDEAGLNFEEMTSLAVFPSTKENILETLYKNAKSK